MRHAGVRRHGEADRAEWAVDVFLRDVPEVMNALDEKHRMGV